MEERYSFGERDMVSRIMSAGAVLAAVAAVAALAVIYGAGYLTVWTGVVGAMILALCAISSPSRIILSDSVLELRCLLETTYLPLDGITSVGRYAFPAAGAPIWFSCGVFGYSGLRMEFPSCAVTRVYARRLDSLIRVCAEGRTYVFSCDDPDALIARLANTGKEAE